MNLKFNEWLFIFLALIFSVWQGQVVAMLTKKVNEDSDSLPSATDGVAELIQQQGKAQSNDSMKSFNHQQVSPTLLPSMTNSMMSIHGNFSASQFALKNNSSTNTDPHNTAYLVTLPVTTTLKGTSTKTHSRRVESTKSAFSASPSFSSNHTSTAIASSSSPHPPSIASEFEMTSATLRILNSTIATSTANGITPSNAANFSTSKNTSLPAGVGVALGILSALAFIIIVVFVYKYQRRFVDAIQFRRLQEVPMDDFDEDIVSAAVYDDNALPI